MAIITKEKVLEFARLQGYDMDIFMQYLSYQSKIAGNKWTIEEYAVSEPSTNTSSRDFLEWFGNWQGFGGADYIPDYCSFEIYCILRDLSSVNTYKNLIVFDDSIYGKGYFIASENLSTIFKLYYDNSDGYPDYHIMAINTQVDEPDLEYRYISLASNTYNKEKLHTLLDNFYNATNGVLIPKSSRNQFFVEKTPNGINMVAKKDIYQEGSASNVVGIYPGDNRSCPQYNAFINFYSGLADISTKENSHEVAKRVLELKDKL